MTPIVRFAPSPTGLLHVGNARMALLNWLHARRGGGSMVLRLDDTDTERSSEAYAKAIQQDLAWLGLTWDRLERQSERLKAYDETADRLRAAGRLYACYETPEELEFKRRRQLARGRPPIYDRTGLGLTAGERQAFEAEGRRPHWRFRLDEGEIAWADLARGPQRFEASNLSDPVVVRADGTFLYMLPSVIDDAAFGITTVVRGEDHVANTAAQIQMFHALDADVPEFAHLPLMTDISGQGLSKRAGARSLTALRDDGVEPMALNALLATVGTGADVAPEATLDDLASAFDISRYGRGTPKFDEGHVWQLNARLLHQMPFEAVADRLCEQGLDRADAAFWAAVRPNLSRLDDAAWWYAVCFGAAEPVVDDPEFAAAAAAILPPEPWTEETWGAWTRAVGDATGRRGKSLFRPLRLALTGVEHGPELKALLPIIGRTRAERRLRGATA